jgi:hypothetical protein
MMLPSYSLKATNPGMVFMRASLLDHNLAKARQSSMRHRIQNKPLVKRGCRLTASQIVRNDRAKLNCLNNHGRAIHFNARNDRASMKRSNSSPSKTVSSQLSKLMSSYRCQLPRTHPDTPASAATRQIQTELFEQTSPDRSTLMRRSIHFSAQRPSV